MSSLYRSAGRLLENDERFVLATVIRSAGSTPRAAGAKMVVRADAQIIDTIGGGLLEAQVIEAAAGVLETGAGKIIHFELKADDSAGRDESICGGTLEVLVERVDATDANRRLFAALAETIRGGRRSLQFALLEPAADGGLRVGRWLVADDGSLTGTLPVSPSLAEQLRGRIPPADGALVATLENRQFLIENVVSRGTAYLFGAGHISLHLAPLAKMVEFRTVVLDDRAEFANAERFAGADEIRVLSAFESCFEDLAIDADSYIVIVTRGHSHDKTVLAQALKATPGYVGMIGSRRKRETLYHQLRNEGFSEDDLARVHSPIGVRIGAETPQEIALSIVAELIRVRAERSI